MKPLIASFKNRIAFSSARIATWSLNFYQILSLLFLIAFFCAGTAFSVLTPAFRAPDENAHWDAAVKRAAGADSEQTFCSIESSFFQFLGSKDIIQKSENSVTPGRFRRINEAIPTCTTSHIWYGNVFTYYGLTLSKFFINHLSSYRKAISNSDMAILSYLTSRFLQGLLILVLLIRLHFLSEYKGRLWSKIGNLWIFSICLAPLFLQSAFSITGDTIVLAATIAMINLAVSLPKITIVDGTIALFLTFQALVAKPVYAPIFGCWSIAIFLSGFYSYCDSNACGFKGLFQKSWLKSRHSLFLGTIIMIFISVGLTFVFKKETANLFPSVAVNPKGQIAFIGANLIEAASIIHSGVPNFLVPEVFWSPLGWFDFMPGQYVFEYWSHISIFAAKIDAVLLLCLFVGFALFKKNLKLMSRIISILAVAGIGVYLAAFASALSMYIYWTPVGLNRVDGLQIRYFFPLLLFLIGSMKFVEVVIRPQIASEFNSSEPAKSLALNAVKILAGTLIAFHLTFFVFAFVLEMLKRYY